VFIFGRGQVIFLILSVLPVYEAYANFAVVLKQMEEIIM